MILGVRIPLAGPRAPPAGIIPAGEARHSARVGVSWPAHPRVSQFLSPLHPGNELQVTIDIAPLELGTGVHCQVEKRGVGRTGGCGRLWCATALCLIPPIPPTFK
jgi:hypothetical protein